jgi:predicted RNA-binding Zn-ribbon protein involved in translation (DUF1610 family)
MDWRIYIYVDEDGLVTERVEKVVTNSTHSDDYQSVEFALLFEIVHKSQVPYYGYRAAKWLAEEHGIRADGRDYRFDGVVFEEEGRVPNDWPALDCEDVCGHLPTRFMCSECGKEVVDQPMRCWLTAHNPVCPKCARRHAHEEGIDLPSTQGGVSIMTPRGW